MSFTQLVSLDQMRNTVRRMTARYDEAQMPTSQVDYYINLAYTLRFPEQFKNIKLTKPYVFTTIPNIDTYDFIYQEGLPTNRSFIISKPTASIGNTAASVWNINTLYSTYIPAISPPAESQIVPGSVTITIATFVPIILRDNGLGTLVGNTTGNSGTINYETGEILVTHTAGAGIAATASFSYNVANNPAFNPPGDIQITPPVYCQGYRLRYFQDKNTFYNLWPNLSVNQIIDVGDSTSGPYTGTIPSTPFYRSQLDVFGNVTTPGVIISAFDNSGGINSGFTYVLTDYPQTNSDLGLLYDTQGNNVGTINYLTGAYTFTVANLGVIPSDATIYAAVVPYQASRPTDVLFYNQQIVLRPCPLQVFQIEFQISQQPTQLIAANDAPELNEWWQFICLLAAELIYGDFPDPEGMAYIQPLLDEQRCEAQRRTLKQLSTQRAATIFSQPGRPLAGFFYGTEYSGSGI